MAARAVCSWRLRLSVLPQIRAAGSSPEGLISRISTRGIRKSSVPIPHNEKPQPEGHVHIITSAALEAGVLKYFCNRNPRNLELLGLAEKLKGFKTALRRVDYYHELNLEVSSRHVSSYVHHRNGTKVVEASTKEFCIARHLYKTSDVAAAYNVGRVIAMRCKETGLYRVVWQHVWKQKNNKKVKAFLKAVARGGIRLNEPKHRLQLPGTLHR